MQVAIFKSTQTQTCHTHSHIYMLDKVKLKYFPNKMQNKIKQKMHDFQICSRQLRV